MLRRDRARIDVEIRAGNLLRGEKLIGRQGVARDISALKQLQAEVADKSKRLALLEDQARTAMDLYRRIADLTIDVPADPDGTGRALRSVEDAEANVIAARMGLSSTDRQIVGLLAAGHSNREIAECVHLTT